MRKVVLFVKTADRQSAARFVIGVPVSGNIYISIYVTVETLYATSLLLNIRSILQL